MTNKDRIVHLLSDIKELESMIAGMQGAEIYPVSFFSRSFDMTHQLLKDIHSLEAAQIEMLQQQMEEHQTIIQTLTYHTGDADVSQHNDTHISQENKVETPREDKSETFLESKSEALEIETGFDSTAPKKAAEPEKAIEEKKPIAETVHKENPVSKPEVIEDAKPTVEAAPIETPERNPLGERTGLFLSDILEKRKLTDFCKAFSLNDRFRFKKDLFGGDEEQMNKTLNILNGMHSYEESVGYLSNVLKWNMEDPTVGDFIKLLEKRFL
jgi:hypothetical protein